MGERKLWLLMNHHPEMAEDGTVDAARGGLDWVKHWNRLLRAVVESLSLEGLNRCGDEILRDMI